MLEKLPDLVNGDAALVARGSHISLTFKVDMPSADGGDRYWLIDVDKGRISGVRPSPVMMPQFIFAIRCAAEHWDEFWKPYPKPGWQDIYGMQRHHGLTIEGELQPLVANLFWFKDVLEAPRRAAADPPPATGADTLTVGHVEPGVGRYMHMEIEGRPHRVYWEEAGSADGIPLLCLHTAGADGRQFRGLLNDPEVTDRFRVVVYDMPRHGKSSPPAGYRGEEYKLTTDGYMNQIIAVSNALGLDRPVVMGCSIGGRIVLHLALDHPAEFRAVIGLQSAAHTAPYYDISWLDRPDVHGGETCAAWISGLFAPDAPLDGRWESLWHYMQGGPGVFKGDLFFYTIDGDIRGRLGGIDTSKIPVHMLTGEYDYSGSPADTREAAKHIDGADVTIIPGLGHFPMSENYPRFREHLLPVLAKIADA